MIVPRRHRRSGVYGAQLGRHLSVRDDAGVERTLNGLDVDDVPSLEEPAVQGALAELRSRVMATRRPVVVSSIVTVVVAALLMPGLAVATVFLVRSAGLVPWQVILAMLAALVVGMAGVFTIVPRISARSLAPRAGAAADFLLRLRRCPACGYPLRADAIPDDGRTACSECGALWNDARLGVRFVPSDPESSPVQFRMTVAASLATRGSTKDAAGRFYAPPSQSPTYRLPGDDLLSTVHRRQLALLALGLASAIAAGVVVAHATATGVIPRPVGVTTIVAIVGLVVLLVVRTSTGIRRRTERTLLDRGICLACRQPLRKDGALLRCGSCPATWKAPITSARD
jgi:hypothetical protein